MKVLVDFRGPLDIHTSGQYVLTPIQNIQDSQVVLFPSLLDSRDLSLCLHPIIFI